MSLGYDPYVYFLRPVGQEGPIKIGCSGMPEHRLAFYATLAPFPLEIVATIPGGLDLENRFHKAFAGQRTHHEWFRASPELTAVIDQIASGCFSMADLPEPNGYYRAREPRRWSTENKLAVRMNAALNRLAADGVSIPSDVTDACRRYNLWGSHYQPVSREPADAHRVRAFLVANMNDRKRLARIEAMFAETRIPFGVRAAA